MANRSFSLNLLLVLCLSTFIASVLTIVKLPTWLFYFRPDWLALITIYWVLAMPERLGIVFCFLHGLLLDLLLFKSFGLNALGFACMGFLVVHYYQQLRIFGLWQQALLIALVICVMKIIVGCIHGFASDFEFASFYWYSLLGDVIVWPFIYIISRDARRSLGILSSSSNGSL